MKVALYGNTFDFNFLKRLSVINSSIYNLIDNENSVFKGDGILKGQPKENPWSYLIGLQLMHC